jgi:hypothetical protein
MITSADNAPWSCDVTIANLARAGLPAPSVVRPAKIAGTPRQDRLHRTIADRPPRRKARQGDGKGGGAKAEGIFEKWRLGVLCSAHHPMETARGVVSF